MYNEYYNNIVKETKVTIQQHSNSGNGAYNNTVNKSTQQKNKNKTIIIIIIIKATTITMLL